MAHSVPLHGDALQVNLALQESPQVGVFISEIGRSRRAQSQSILCPLIDMGNESLRRLFMVGAKGISSVMLKPNITLRYLLYFHHTLR
jgi:hypothetical protein